MKVLIIGGGGREHALAWKIAQSPLLTKLYAAPGNAGIANVAECHPIAAEDSQVLLNFAKQEKIDLTVVGPEAPLVNGIVDDFQNAGLKIFGPSKAAAQLEASKAFAKDRMTKYEVPTAHYEVFSHINEAKHYVIEAEMPIVIKADGLAAGKGVMVCETSQDAVAALDQIMGERVFGDSGNKVIIEKKLEGEELSVLALCDGETIVPLASSQDHKRAYDHDKGPNTGGMGAYSPCPLVSGDEFEAIVQKSVEPIVRGMAQDGIPYRGLLYAGIMMTQEGPQVLEYNCRFGDPEAQVVIPRLKSDLLPILDQIASGKIENTNLEWHPKSCLGVVVASGGYPGHYEKGFPIQGIDAIDSTENAYVFHAGTSKSESGYVSSGGRVLLVAALGDTLREAHDFTYSLVKQVSFKEAFFRRDIGRKALEVLR